MSITVALTHRTSYRYDRAVALSPHVVRLRPAPHARTPILSYSQRVGPGEHFVNWQQDPFANWNARLVFPERVHGLEVEVELIARMDAINPFDFFVEEGFEDVPFTYRPELAHDLAPYLKKVATGDAFAGLMREAPKPEGRAIDFLVAINQFVQGRVGYVVRMEPGVQTPDETIAIGTGSCRDSGWLLCAMLREYGYAARFVSGYLIQLAADEKAIDGPSGPEADFTDLHAWCEIFLPGAGWVGLDPTSGLFAGEGHIPLACTPEPRGAAPIDGAMERCEVEFDVHMEVRRIHETPRVTKPVTDAQWARIDAAGRSVDARIAASDMRLTMGGEPTFVSAYDRDGAEWTTAAVGPTKRAHAEALVRRLQEKFAPQGLLHFGQGKWYPGEQLPRWAFSLYWRTDGQPMWTDPALIAPEGGGKATADDAEAFLKALTRRLGIDEDCAQPAYEDVAAFAVREQQLPENVDPADSKLEDPQERARLARVFGGGLSKPSAWVLPIQLAQAPARSGGYRWQSERWRTRRRALHLIPGDSPAGFRLPLQSLSWLPEDQRPQVWPRDPFAPPAPLPEPARIVQQTPGMVHEVGPAAWGASPDGHAEPGQAESAHATAHRATHEPGQMPGMVGVSPGEGFVTVFGSAVRTAMAVEPRNGTLCVFMPPTGSADEYVDLIAAIEETAQELGQPIHVEGYPPPGDARVNVIKVTPDPGVIEVNVQPAHSWEEQKRITETLYEEARQCRLDASSFQIDGRPTGSGGGNHIVVGGSTPEDSPFLRRPDMLGSVIRYWQTHPSLSYLFSGMFIGPTSQAPRMDEARMETLDEMEIALAQLPPRTEGWTPSWLVDRIFRHLLIDVTGNTHRAEICIDKLYSPDGPTGRLGLVEFRAFEMPPHARMSLAQSLLIRALLAWFWETPYTAPLRRWGPELHDRYLLPHFVWRDFRQVLGDLSSAHGVTFDPAWFSAQFEFRFPVAGTCQVGDATIELRSAIEPWNVLGEEATASGASRFVDSSVERIQVRVDGELPPGCALACNGIEVPLNGPEQVAGVRFRAWQPPSCLHPTIGVHAPLTFDVVERATGFSRGGCTYHVHHPGGRAHETRPINALEAEGRRLARFDPRAHTPGQVGLRDPGPQLPGAVTLDLRRVR